MFQKIFLQASQVSLCSIVNQTWNNIRKLSIRVGENISDTTKISSYLSPVCWNNLEISITFYFKLQAVKIIVPIPMQILYGTPPKGTYGVLRRRGANNFG